MVLSFDPAAAAAVAAGAALYGIALRRLHHRGTPWPAGRAAAWWLAMAVLVAATQGPLAAAESERFTAHAVQHVLLGMAAPILLALGAPVTLVLQAAGRSMQVALLRIVHSRPVSALTHPAVALVLFGGGLFVLYLTPLYELSLRNGAVHAAVHVHFVAAGCVFFWPLVGHDPVRWRLPHAVRMALVLVTVPIHALLGIALLSTDELLDEGRHTLADQRTGAGLVWAAGDLLGIAAAAVVLAQWMRHDDREAAREDRRLDAAAVVRARGDPPA